MTLYGYQCRECGREYTSEFRGNVLCREDGQIAQCDDCGAYPVKRRYSVNVHRPMARHFNQSVGKEIGSDRQFRDELKRRGEAEFARTGIETDYQPLDPEIARKRVEETGAVGLESTNRVRAAEGKPTVDV